MRWWTLETLTITPGLPDHADDVVLLGDVALHQNVADAMLVDPGDAGLDLLLGALGLLGPAPVVDGHVGAILREADGDRLPDAGAAAGDQHVPALEPSHGCLLCGLAPLRLG